MSVQQRQVECQPIFYQAGMHIIQMNLQKKIQSTYLGLIGEIEKALNKSAIGGTEIVSIPEIVKAYIDRIST